MPDEYDEYDEYDGIGVLFAFSKWTFDDLGISFEYQGLRYENIAVEFEFFKAGYYNYQNFGLLFEATMGSDYSDMPLIFSVIKQPQTFMSYIFQKLYCVCSELSPVYDDIALQNWNVKPNQIWYVSVTSAGVVTLYDTLADITAGTNPVAIGTANADLLVILTYVSPETVMDYYYTDLVYHLSLSVLPSGTRKFKVKPLTDLSEIRHAIYNNSNITISRGQAELNLHTYAIKGREIVLGTHLPTLECGDNVDLTSTRRNKTAEKSQVLSQTIAGEVSDGGETSLVTTINVANYVELFR